MTTNPPESTGDGIAMALRRDRGGRPGVRAVPPDRPPPPGHAPAAAVGGAAGHGALLRDANGERFVDELLPRDKVSQAIMTRLAEQGTDHVWLDATGLERFGQRFPTIAASLAARASIPGLTGSRWRRAHYNCGGIVADLDGASSLPGLWVAGKPRQRRPRRQPAGIELVARRHGVRPRVVEAVEQGKDGPSPTGAMRCVLDGDDDAIPGRAWTRRCPLTAGPRRWPWRRRPPPIAGSRRQGHLQRAMTAGAGVLRSADSLERAP